MRAPRCWIRYQGAVIEALAELALDQFEGERKKSWWEQGPTAAQKIHNLHVALKEMREHVEGCEECETP